MVNDVPRTWDHRAVADLLGTAFVDPVILSHRWMKNFPVISLQSEGEDGRRHPGGPFEVGCRLFLRGPIDPNHFTKLEHWTQVGS